MRMIMKIARRRTSTALMLVLCAVPASAQQPRAPVASAPPAATSTTAAAQNRVVQQLRLAIAKCWVFDPSAAPTGSVATVQIDFDLKRNGTLLGVPHIVHRRGTPTPVALAQTAVRAIQTCAPYTGLPAELFETGQQRVRLTFDAKGTR
jgi:hypothetical protein